MLHVDITASLASVITASKGIPDQDLSGLRTGMKRYIEEWLAERKNGEHRWSMDPYDKDVLQQVKDTAKWVKHEGIKTVIWIGIGGSGLGPKVIQEMHEGPETVEFILLDTIDPSIIEMIDSIVDWRSTLVVVASKSGGTLEPMSVFFYCWDRLKEVMKDKANSRVIAITDPLQGLLRSFCLDHVIKMLPIPTNVGGRFSIFTPIGLLPLALLGADTDAFVRGAKEMDTACQNSALEENPAALLAGAQFLIDTKRGNSVRVIMPYVQRLESFARWNQQLIAESLGKVETSNPIPLAAIGTQDQHSLLQQWMAGPRSCWHIFIRAVEKPRVVIPDDVDPSFGYIAGKTFSQLLDACYEGTSRALTEADRPHATITLQTLDDANLGQLFFLFLTEVVLLGRLYRIDPYGQPAVEAGKKITKEILSGGSEDRE